MDLSVELAQRIDHIEDIGLVEVFLFCNGDPRVEFVDCRVFKVLSFRDAVGIYSVSCGRLSE